MVKCCLPVYLAHPQVSSSVYKVHYVIILGVQVTSLVPFLLLNAIWSPSTSSIFLWILLLSVITAFFVLCAMRLGLIVWWSLHFVAFGFFKAIIVTSVIHCPVSCVLFISCVTISRPLSANGVNTFCICIMFLKNNTTQMQSMWCIFFHYMLPSTNWYFSASSGMCLSAVPRSSWIG